LRLESMRSNLGELESSICVGVPAAAAEHFAGCGAGEFAVIVFDLTVDDGVGDTFGELRWTDESCAIDDGRGIEDGYVGEIAGFEEAAVFEVFALSGPGSDFADGRF